MLISELPYGIHQDVPADVYHRRELGIVNKSALDQIARSPAHYRAWLASDDSRDTPALAFGRALHTIVLEPDAFQLSYALAEDAAYRRPTPAQRNAKKPSDETLRAIEYWDARNAALSGKTELTAEDWTTLHEMREAILSHPVASKLFVGGLTESTLVWDEGLVCKARLDYWRQDINVIADLKSTEDASPGAFARSIAAYRYHVQQAHYTAGAEACGFNAPTFLFVAIEKSRPYAIGFYQLDRESVARGDTIRARDIHRLDECLWRDEWPSYPTGVTTLSLPAWAFRD